MPTAPILSNPLSPSVSILGTRGGCVAELEITVLKYESDYTKRSKDIKRNTWFSFSNDLLLHPDFDEINGEELKWFLWIVSICSKKNQNKIRLNIPHAEKKLSLNSKDLFSMIKKLEGNQIDVVRDQSAASARPVGDQSAASTLHYITLHNTTLHNTTSTPLVFDFEKIYKGYPKKEGKLDGIRVLKETIKTQDQFDQFANSVENYVKKIKIEKIESKYIKQFSSFVGPKNSPRWTDFVDWKPVKQNSLSRDVDGDEEINAINREVGLFE